MKKIAIFIAFFFILVIPSNQNILAQGKTQEYEEVIGDKGAGPGGIQVCYCYQTGSCKCFIPKNPSLY